MESKPHLSTREIRILRNYGLAIAGIIAFYFLLGWVRAGVPVGVAMPYQAEIAVLAPLTGESAQSGKQILDVVTQSKDFFVKELELKDWNVIVVGYDIGNTPQSAAWGAVQAARNPNTVAILGPLDARQIIAVRNTVAGKDLPILTVSSTASDFETSATEGVYRIPGPDNLQGPAIVDFLLSKPYVNVVLLVEPTAYTKKILATFNEAANNRLRLVGVAEINPAQNQVDGIKKISETNPEAVVYLGGSKGLELIIQEIQKTAKQIPIVGVDSLNDPKIAALLANGQELYFTSPIYVNTNIAGPYLNLPASRENGPYSFQTVQATGIIMEALMFEGNSGLGRKTVWENLSDLQIPGVGSSTQTWENGQLSPMYMYVYRGTDEETMWLYSPAHSSTP